MPYLTHNPLDIAEWRQVAVDKRDGASVEFLGIVRGQEGGQTIAYLDYEAYEPMAERLIAQCIEEAKTRWSLHQVHIRHRVGRVAVGEVAVLIGVQAPHREEAFEACQSLIDAIKRDAPIWKMAYDAHEDVAEPHGHARGTSKPTPQVGRHPAHAKDSPTPPKGGVAPGGMEGCDAGKNRCH